MKRILILLMVSAAVFIVLGCKKQNRVFPQGNREAWMQVDSVSMTLVGCVNTCRGRVTDTLTHYEPSMEVYPIQVYTIETDDGSIVYLFMYTFGYLLHYDEVQTCIVDRKRLLATPLFEIEGHRDSVIGRMWFDQLIAASDGFPFEDNDDIRFGIHYDSQTKRLYIPIMDHFEEGSEFEGCQRYTGRFEVLLFDGEKFVPDGTDGAWWLSPKMRSYQRTVSNRKTEDGIEQVDLMPDGSIRRSIWKGAITLDDIHYIPDEVYITSIPFETYRTF